MARQHEMDDTTDEAPEAPERGSGAVADALQGLRRTKRLTQLGVYLAIASYGPVYLFVLHYQLRQVITSWVVGVLIATVAIEFAFSQIFKLRKRSAYPNVLVMELGGAQSLDAAARRALPVLHRCLGLRASFLALGRGRDDLGLVSVSGMTQKAAERVLRTGSADIDETMRTQQPLPWSSATGLAEAGLNRHETLIFIPVTALRQSIGVLAVAGNLGTKELRDDQLLKNIGSALGLSLENLHQKQALRESEEKFRDLVENTSDVLWEMDENGAYTYCSPNVASIIGYEPEELIGKTPFEFMPPEEAKRVGDLFGKIVAERRPYSLLAHQIRYKDGRLGVMECSGRPVFDEQGRWVGYRGVDRDVTDRKRAEEALSESEEQFRTLVESAFEGVVVSENGKILEANESLATMFGYKLREVIGLSPHELTTAESAERIMNNIKSGFEKPYEITGVKRDGTTFDLEVIGKSCLYRGREARITAMRDITELKRAEEALRESESQFRTLAETSAAAAFIYQGTFMRYVNSAAEAVTGYTRDELLAMDFWDVIHPDHREMVKERGLARQRGEDVPPRYEAKILTKSGEERWVEFTAGAIEFEGKPAVLGTAFDITERKQAEETIRHLAYHDALTGLPNRALFEDRLTVALAQAHRREQIAAVMFLDLDRFKVVNDTVGHAHGDKLLKSVAERLSNLVRDGDTVARVGGDEFTLLLPDVESAEEIAEIADRILEALRRPLQLDGQEFHVTTSVGIAIYPNDGQDAESLLRNADTAMYRAKDQGRDNYKLYTPAMNNRIAERLALEKDLRRALERDEFVVHYQPQLDVKTGRIVGAEALVRWQHPERGLVPPMEFIPFAEESGLILPIGDRVIGIACRQAKAWQEKGLPTERMAVNISARRFHDANVAETVARLLGEAGLSPEHLQLELTESVVMADLDFTVEVLRELREMGVAIAIDDFGTGYSSLSYLKRLPIDAVKIDQSFVRDLGTDPSDDAIVATIIDMAHSLNLRVVAEGVETEEQLAFLKERQCDEMQGFLFSKPKPADVLQKTLRKNGRSSRAQRPARARAKA